MSDTRHFTGISPGAHTLRDVLLISLAVFASIRSAHADDGVGGVIREQDIDVPSMTRALTPEEPDDGIVTRGFVPMNKTPGAKPAAASTQKAQGVQILITFASNSTTLTESAQTALDKVAAAMQSDTLAAYKFRVEGHADPRGSADANMKLSADRAAAVVDYLSKKDGVAAERLSSVGKGSFEPLNRRDPTAPENRRVTILTVKE
jgi:outer membrane protein OmpA-like peptidoglycan-associated protein